METLILVLMFILAMLVFRDTMLRSTFAIHQAILRHALTTNLARFGDASENRIVIVDKTRGYFMKDNMLWVCEVDDGEPDPTTAKPIDMFTLPIDDLDEVQAVVDVLNSSKEKGDDD